MSENRMEKINGPESCKFFDSCSANLCPLDPRLKEMLRCPEENELDSICKNREFAGLQFIRTQKRMASATRNKKHERNDYFSFEMLNRNIVVRSGIEGIPEPPDSIRDYEKWYSDKGRKWIESHPEISRERREAMRALGLKSIKLIQKPLSHPSISEIADSKGVIGSSGYDTLKN